jgi:hypothetical protein
MLAGGKFYDLETAIPYNPGSGSSKGAEYTLTAIDDTKRIRRWAGLSRANCPQWESP